MSKKDGDDKELKRKKQFKRMSKIVAGLWELDDPAFQNNSKSSSSHVLCLESIGQKIDAKTYKLGRHGWEDFARDLGGVYNRHIKKKTKKASIAAEHLKTVKELLAAKEPSLAKIAADAMPSKANGDNAETPTAATSTPSKKRKAPPAAPSSSKKARSLSASKAPPLTPAFSNNKLKANQNLDLADREIKALEMLADFMAERGGQRGQIAGFTARVTKKKERNKYDTNYFSPEGRRFRSMLEVGRFFGLVNDGGREARKRRVSLQRSSVGSKEQQAEKKSLRRELERLRKTYNRATKALDDFAEHSDDVQYPIDDRLLVEQEEERRHATAVSSSVSPADIEIVTRQNCAAALQCDVTGFPGLPGYCIPDVLMAWDFLCTFQRVLSLSPIALDDFAAALAYVPPAGQVQGDDVMAPPVYLSEAHLALLKLLVHDKSSEDWWWSILESDHLEPAGGEVDDDGVLGTAEREGAPVIKVNLSALLGEVEDPLITASWLQSLDGIASGKSRSAEEMRNTIKTALKVLTNKWVAAYLKKTLDGIKTNGLSFARAAVKWLVDRVHSARPDLTDRLVKEEMLLQMRAKVVEDAEAQMKELGGSVPAVTYEDVVSDDDEDSDDSDDEDDTDGFTRTDSRDEQERPASSVPPKPLPTLVDLLLPPSKPSQSADYLTAFTWPALVAAAAKRVLHRKKRVWNEIDDSLRHQHNLVPLRVPDRRLREQIATARTLTECGMSRDETDSVEAAVEFLCNGGEYLKLSASKRLCLLRVLIEASYDSARIYEVVDGNYKQRVNAMKSLEQEQRKAKKDAKEKATADEAAAREKLAFEAKEAFLDEKRDEIRKLNEKSGELTDDVIESLTDEDIIDFDEDIKADYDALPAPDTFTKSQVADMVARMKEEAAFDTDALRVLAMDEIIEREARELEEMEGQFSGLGGESILNDPDTDRDTYRQVERLQKDIVKMKDLVDKLPTQRESAIEQLKDAMQDGTMKVLRSALTAAKKVKLQGPDDETGGTWALDLLRDAALELEKAKQNKKVVDAQRDLVAKRNKCFIRTDPIGVDRFGNRFWGFDVDDDGQVWIDAEFVVRESNSNAQAVSEGYADLSRTIAEISTEGRDLEEDFTKQAADGFLLVSRLEHHSSGMATALTLNHWGCQTTENSLRAVIKGLDGRGLRENELKSSLKDFMEVKAGGGEKVDEGVDAKAGIEVAGERLLANGGTSSDDIGRLSGDEDAFAKARDAVREKGGNCVAAAALVSAIGQKVRTRVEVEKSKDGASVRYGTGIVLAWKFVKIELADRDDDAMDMSDEDQPMDDKMTPYWKVFTDRGHTLWMDGPQLIESISRYGQMSSGRGYFEDDAAFLAYRNNLGRFLGKVSEAPYAVSPSYLAKYMIKKESELYPKLKAIRHDNCWGGKSGARALWINSMRDYAFDLSTVRQGVLTLEGAFFELTGEFEEYDNVSEEVVSAKALLHNPESLKDIELESEKNIKGLWNSPSSRAVFSHIVTNASTIAFVALAFELLCRNTMGFLKANKALDIRVETQKFEPEIYSRSARRRNVDYTQTYYDDAF